LIDLLKEDKYSRRAILNLYDPESGLDYFAKDIACVSTVQFLVRKNKLDLIVTMRSNDIIWGLPYDIFFFSMLQELLSLELNVELGTYYHNVGSMHLYERHFSLGKEMLSVQNTISQEQPKMEHIEDLDLFINLEEVIRKSNISLEGVNSQPISQYWKDLLVKLWHFKNNRK
jgi:thymidylate synthase